MEKRYCPELRKISNLEYMGIGMYSVGCELDSYWSAGLVHVQRVKCMPMKVWLCKVWWTPYPESMNYIDKHYDCLCMKQKKCMVVLICLLHCCREPVAESAHSERYETELIIWIIRCQSQLVNSARNTEFEIVPVYAWDLSLAYFISEDCCVHV